jgi:hypothetical protein
MPTSAQEAEKRRSDQVEQARDHARDLRDRHIASGAFPIPEEMRLTVIADGIAWVAAELRVDRMERYDRLARKMEGKDPLRRARRDRSADSP